MNTHPFDSSPSPEGSKDAMTHLDSYLDDQLGAEDRAQFEVTLGKDPNLRAHVARQREIDHALQRMFVPPAVPAALLQRIQSNRNGHLRTDPARPAADRAAASGAGLNGSVTVVSKPRFDHQQPPARSFGNRQWLRIAAVLFFLLLGPVAVYQSWQAYDSSRQSSLETHPPAALEVNYDNQVAAGFAVQPDSCATNNNQQTPLEAFQQALATQFGLHVATAELPADVKITGWYYSCAISAHTVSLLAEVDGKHVELFVDLEANKPIPDDSKRSSPHVFQKNLGSVTFYEVTPLGHPALLDLFSLSPGPSR